MVKIHIVSTENGSIPIILPDLNTDWETVKTNANKVPGIDLDVSNIKDRISVLENNTSVTNLENNFCIRSMFEPT
jgi:hypothetical protein